MYRKIVMAVPEGSLVILPDGEASSALSIVLGVSAQGKPAKVEMVNLTCQTSRGVEVFLRYRGGVVGVEDGTEAAILNEQHFGAYWTLEGPGASSGAARRGRVTVERLAFLGKCQLDGATHGVYGGVPRFDDAQPPELDGLSWRKVYRAAGAEAARLAPQTSERQAIVQEAVVRLFIHTRKRGLKGTPAQAMAFVRGIVRYVALERGRRRGRGPVSLDAWDASEPLAGDDAPADATELADLRDRLRRACSLLPAPYRQIAAMRLRGATRRSIAVYLGAWRSVGTAEARRLGKQTLQMLRLALAGVDLRRRFPRRFAKKSAWNSTPPPAFRHRDVGGPRWSSRPEPCEG